jgi:leader peptidase (prepilin peptidase)/N-methyltransferase
MLDLVPLLSFVWLRGRCRHCNAVIAPWLLYLEIAATGVGVVVALVAPVAGLAWGWAVWLWVLLALITCDVTRFRLPNALTLALFLCALALAELPVGVGLGNALVGALVGAGSFALLRWGYWALRGREGLGLGDVKLMAGLGAWVGPWDLPLLVLVASAGALTVALVSGALRPSPGGTPVTLKALPFGAALCAAAVILWVWRVAAMA